VALGKITMSVTFGYVHNTRTEQAVFDIIDMEYPYNAIIGRGTLNAFKSILHLAYLRTHCCSWESRSCQEGRRELDGFKGYP
jgi:deoxyxylulose-5-phosphate synthase